MNVIVHLPDLNNSKISYHIPVQSNSKILYDTHGNLHDVIVGTIIGQNLSNVEITTWISYHRKIGVEHFILYLLQSVETLSKSFVENLNQLAVNCKFCFSLCNWHQYHVMGPHPIKFDQVI